MVGYVFSLFLFLFDCICGVVWKLLLLLRIKVKIVIECCMYSYLGLVGIFMEVVFD